MEKSISLQEASPASPSALREAETEQMTPDTFGPKCSVLYGKFAPAGSLRRTFADLLVGMKGWYSTRCMLTWKVKASKSGRLYCQLAPSTPRTEEKGFGLLPTPRVVEVVEHPEKVSFRLKDRTPNALNNLASAAKYGLLPTPRACESIERRNMKTVIDKVENGGDVTLTTLAKYKGGMLLPTPMAAEGNKCAINYKEGSQMGTALTPTINKMFGTASQLNPRFVAEMMGFPVNWTELPFQSGEMKP